MLRDERLLIVSTLPTLVQDPIELDDYSIAEPSAPRRRNYAQLPQGYNNWNGLSLSPLGRHLVWTLVHEPVAPPRVLRWFYSLAHMRVRRTVALWTNAPDGSGMREIGSAVSASPADDPSDIEWLPDESSISFLIHHQLYTVALPR